MLYENFYYMVLTRHSAGKSGRQFVFKVLYYIVRLIRYDLIWLVFCIRLWQQVNLMKMIIYMFTTQRQIKNPVKHNYRLKTLNYFRKNLYFR